MNIQDGGMTPEVHAQHECDFMTLVHLELYDILIDTQRCGDSLVGQTLNAS